jgi:hypothetical protein
MNVRPILTALLLCGTLALSACIKPGTGDRFRSAGASTQSSALHAAQHDEAKRAFQYPERRLDGRG